MRIFDKNQGLDFMNRIIMSSVLPFCLGVNTTVYRRVTDDPANAQGVYHVVERQEFNTILKRGLTVPNNNTEEFHPVTPWQKNILFFVLSGEATTLR